MTYKEMIKTVTEANGENTKYIMQNSVVRGRLDYVLRAEQSGTAKDYTYSYAIKDIAKIANAMLTPYNVKIGDGVTVNLWSDRHAATVIKVTKTTVTVQHDKATLDPNFKPQWIGSHCTNQEQQSYTYEQDPNGEIETFHWSNKIGRYGAPGNPFLSKDRHEFYDYNF